jgi:hypothetical protein
MATSRTSLRVRNIGILSLILGLLGAAFYWWTPMGIVLSLAGLVFGLVGWTSDSRGSNAADHALVIGGTLLSLAALILGFVIADLNLELIKLHAFR